MRRYKTIALVLSMVIAIAVANPTPAGAIVGGTLVDPAPPWMASVRSNTGFLEGLSGCSGSIIAPRFVLTAAHCVTVGIPSPGILPGPFKWRPSSDTAKGDVLQTTIVRPDQRVIGVNTVTSDGGDQLGVKTIHVHPQYRAIIRYKVDKKDELVRVKCDWLDRSKSCREVQAIGVEWDLAIIELTDPVPAPAEPVTLGSVDDVVGDQIAYGYGATTDNGKKSDGKLRATTAGDLKPSPECDSVNWPDVGESSRDLSGWYCVTHGTSRPAPGDSGGPHIKWVGSEAVQVAVTSWGGADNAWVADIGAARTWISGVAGLAGGGDEILIIGAPVEDSINNLGSGLEAAGYTIWASPALPDDLSKYAAIFDVEIFSAYDEATRTRLAAFVRSGGGLYLTGERPCCASRNASIASLIQELILDPGVVVETVDAGFRTAAFPLNADVAYGVDESPNSVSSVVMSAPGGISGVEPENVLVAADAPYAAGAIWGDAEVSGGQGRVAVLMDINWLNNAYNPDTSNRDAFIENLARFLTVR